MAKPSRLADSRPAFEKPRTFFVTSSTAGGRALFQTERMCNLIIDVLRSYTLDHIFTVHDFVVMPNHVHLLITVPGEMTIEKAMQRIKGGFSFRARKELGFHGEIWQRGFSEVGVHNSESLQTHRRYIELNPVRAGLANSSEEYPYCSVYLRAMKRARAEARPKKNEGGTTQVVP